MAEAKLNVLETLMKAYQESEGEYVDLIVEHGELPGVTMDNLKFWGEYMNVTANYIMWHPLDHISHETTTVTDQDGNAVTYMYAEEKVGDYPASILRLRQEAPDSAPVKQVYSPLATNTMLGPNDEIIGGIYHEVKPTPTGIIMRSTFRLPARTPQDFLDAMYRHSKEEMGNFPKFLPELYTRETGKK